MSRTVTIKSTGKKLYVVGDAPKDKGDRFEATTMLSAGPPPGCVQGSLPGGGAYFACQRGGGISAPVRSYKFDPEKHELDGEG